MYLKLEAEHISSNQVHANYLYSPIGMHGALSANTMTSLCFFSLGNNPSGDSFCQLDFICSDNLILKTEKDAPGGLLWWVGKQNALWATTEKVGLFFNLYTVWHYSTVYFLKEATMHFARLNPANWGGKWMCKALFELSTSLYLPRTHQHCNKSLGNAPCRPHNYNPFLKWGAGVYKLRVSVPNRVVGKWKEPGNWQQAVSSWPVLWAWRKIATKLNSIY